MISLKSFRLGIVLVNTIESVQTGIDPLNDLSIRGKSFLVWTATLVSNDERNVLDG